ncbi:uncharacterized protein Mb0901 [Actinomycetota bacterium]|nr:uncharacterized protein Mb0901 [Actinomycetota bacterium]
MAKKSLVKKAPKETSKKVASNAPAPFDAKNLAHSAIFEHAEKREHVGSFISAEFDDENRVATYLFNANLVGYKGWRWCVTVAKVDADATPTVCDVVVLPGPDALLAPEWIPYRDRIQPGDVGVGDIVPSSLDDARLVPGQSALPHDEDLDTAMAVELGFGRARVMSIEGRDQAAKRWYDGDRGPQAPLAQAHLSHVIHADSFFPSQAHCAQPLACAQMQFPPMMHAWSLLIMDAALTRKRP